MSAQELSVEAEKFLQTGKLFDAAGFSGEGGEFELYDFVEAASDLIPYHFDTDEYRDDVRSALVSECRELQEKGYKEDRVASYLLGSVMWRVSSSDSLDASPKELKALLARTVHNITQSREAFGRGDEKLFHFAFANYTESFGSGYSTGRRHSLRQLCRHIENVTSSERRSVMPVVEQGERVSWRHHVLRGMAIIAMKDAYLIQPPADQTDENGAWQLPHERDEDDGDF